MQLKTPLLLQSSRTALSGTIQIRCYTMSNTGESSAMFLPMINLNPSDPSCICTIMQFVSYRDKQYDANLILTFDQPLYRKAGGSDLKRMFVILRRFHMQTSFLCSIGHLMADSGLQYLLEVVFAGNAIRHMLTGKTISVAVCGHMLIEAELIIILVAKVYHIPLSTNDTDDPRTGHIKY